jgi:hypothetical protein
VIIAVIAVRMVEMAVYQVIHMIAMRHLLMSASRTVNVILCMACADVVGRTYIGICCADSQYMFIDMTVMRMM